MTDAKTFWERNRWKIIGGIIILFVMVGLIVYYRRRKILKYVSGKLEEQLKENTTSTGVNDNHNVGNIRATTAVTYPGEVKSSKAFKVFESDAYGFAALFHDLYVKQYNHNYNTIRKVISVYAPPQDNNDTEAYIKMLADHLGIGGDEVFTIQQMWVDNNAALIKSWADKMSDIERGHGYSKATIEDGFNIWYNAHHK